MYDQELRMKLLMDLQHRILAYHRHLVKPTMLGFTTDHVKEWEELCKEHEKEIKALKKRIKKSVFDSEKQRQKDFSEN